jgi:hypothetical protein
MDVLRIDRVAADYNLSSSLPQSAARSDVQESRAIVVDFQALLVQIPSADIADGARRYLQAIGRLGRTP